MIHRYSNESQTRWDHGDYRVRLDLPNIPRPMGFCDGTDEDIAELRSIAESEGADDFVIHKKLLETGREIWTLGGPG